MKRDYNMGGNVTAIIKKTGQESRAEKIPIAKIGVEVFREKMIDIFKNLNSRFNAKYGDPLWSDESIIENGTVFNGSTSYIMDPKYIPKEIEQYKASAGDIDIMISISQSEKLYDLLESLEGMNVTKDSRYMGSKTKSRDRIGNQINSVFEVQFIVDKQPIKVFCQVDFELTPFSGGKPTEWARFSHSSSFEDAKQGVKAVHHKYLIRAFVGATSVRDDILIATKTSTPENLKFKKTRGENVTVANMMKFSVGLGARLAFVPILDSDNNPLIVDGKHVLKEIPTADSDFKTSVESIFELVFGKTPSETEKKQFWSFIGVVKLMKRYFNKEQIERTNRRYVELLWGLHVGQKLERGNPELDFEVKNSGYQYWIKETKANDLSKSLIDPYYAIYPTGSDAPDDVDEFA